MHYNCPAYVDCAEKTGFKRKKQLIAKKFDHRVN